MVPVFTIPMFEMVPKPWMVLPLVNVTLGLAPTMELWEPPDDVPMLTVPAPLRVTFEPVIFMVALFRLIKVELVSVPEEVRFSVVWPPAVNEPLLANVPTFITSVVSSK
jgi:hypothetical protein